MSKWLTSWGYLIVGIAWVLLATLLMISTNGNYMPVFWGPIVFIYLSYRGWQNIKKNKAEKEAKYATDL